MTSNILDVNNIPAEILEAERNLSRWMKTNGFTHWALGDTCSRSFANKLSGVQKIINDFSKENNVFIKFQ